MVGFGERLLGGALWVFELYPMKLDWHEKIGERLQGGYQGAT